MIKRASNDDSLILAKMAVKIWDNESTAELSKEFDDMADNPDVENFIKYTDGKPVGFANVSLRYDYVEGCDSSPVGYLEGIYIGEDYRGKQYARELVETCESWAREMGCVEFASDCDINNFDSLGFHIALGFVEANRIICFKKDL